MPKRSPHTIVLVRTSPTRWDEEGRLCGDADVPPTSDGLSSLTQDIRRASIDALREGMTSVFCGPDDLSQQCAALLKSNPETRVKPMRELRELNLGLWDGVLRDELGGRFPRVYSKWRDTPGQVAPPQGESLEVVHERIRDQWSKSFKRLRAADKVVGLVLRPYAWCAFNCWLRGRSLSDAWEVMRDAPSVQAFTLLTPEESKRDRRLIRSA